MNDEILEWVNLGSSPGPEIPLFNIRYDRMRHPTSATEFKRLVFESSDWVNVVAVTTERKIVMVEQYRFGVGSLTIEPVGGLIDPGEDSLTAAKRELLEEAGFGGGTWRYLEYAEANPAIHNNVCHHWLAEGVVQIQEPTPDEGEAIRVHQMTLSDVKEAIASGKFRHPLGLSAMARVFPLWDPILGVEPQ